MASHRLILAFLALVTSTAAAQRVFVIGSGGDFIDLPYAEAAAQDGDIFDVRGLGPYTAITTSKALTILGNGANIQASLAYPFRVVGLAAGRDFVLQNVRFYMNPQLPAPLVEEVDCMGRVHLEDVGLANNSGRPAIAVDGCAAVTIGGTYVMAGSPALRVRNSTVTANASMFASSTPFPGIVVQDSVLYLADVQAIGGFGAGTAVPPSPGMTLSGSMVTVGAGANGRLAAGLYGAGGGSAPVPAVSGQTSTLRIDPSVPVETRGGAQPFVGVNVVTNFVPSLSQAGQYTVFLAFRGNPAALNVTLLGLPADPLEIPPLGSLWLAPVTVLVVAGVPTNFRSTVLPKGTTMGIQVASIVGLGVELSNPTMVTAQ